MKLDCSNIKKAIGGDCLARDTMVLMSDGMEKQICNIRVGDKVRTPEQKEATIIDVMRGMERSLICIETSEGHCLRMTAEHPVVTKRGMVAAQKLHAGDEVKTRTGYKYLTQLCLEDYDDIVFNLYLQEDALFYANGIEVGDFKAQNKLSKGQAEQPELKPE